MLFNSLPFLIFFPAVCILFWVLPQNLKNIFLLIASYFFYMNWKPIYALLILFSTLITWLSGIYIDKYSEKKNRKRVLIACLIANLSILFLFKYEGFFTQSINSALELLHVKMHIPGLHLLLPVGISFYTFQAIGYVVDVYRGNIKPERNLGIYALFISFFPQLVAGPIERAQNLLPQFRKTHKFNSASFIDGLKMMIWGYFMKLCIADRVAGYVNAVFYYYMYHNGSSLLLGTFFFTFQIFCDFAGYSLIAIGVARCLGFKLMLNFNRPYLSNNIKEFWRRWHISLSSWFKDYVYIPLGGSRRSYPRTLLNTFLTFLVSGIWHGANYTFILWGAVHGSFMIIHSLLNKYLPFKIKIPNIIKIGFTFTLVMLSWVIFRARNIEEVFIILRKIATEHGPIFKGAGIPEVLLALTCIAILMFKEIKDEKKLNIHFLHNKNIVVSTVSMALLICFILLFGEFSGAEFIYFQF
ncbi:alginate O-acetyltransferase complex protein AlgI [Dysgonomonadaceae bacterium PH5-43]|nr:alginate O-acetyltransferase complex protein AlgI [Dysgonomonadaceae bacterium PH5-43]